MLFRPLEDFGAGKNLARENVCERNRKRGERRIPAAVVQGGLTRGGLPVYEKCPFSHNIT